MGVFTRKRGAPVPIDLGAIIAENLMPIAGVFLLGWDAAGLVVLYFTGFLVDISVCVGILLALEAKRSDFLDGPDTPVNRVKMMLGVGLALLALLAIFALVFGFPLLLVFGEGSGSSLRALLADRGFLMALALHVLLTARAGIHTGRDLTRHKGEDPTFDVVKAVRGQFAFVTSRWVAVYAASFFLPIPTVLVIAYCIASVYFSIKRPQSL